MGVAVAVRNAWKFYKVGTGKEAVLKELNMTIPVGALYCLLGSSGCGKTTLLSCILGIHELNKGTITVFGETPGKNEIEIPGKNVGYMPQDISLYGEFSILETFIYFGTLGGLSKTKVAEKSIFLEQLLELPPLTRRVNTLSGGEQRRVSFAVSLIHDPKLVILDEPTVGVDPLLREKIWTHLQKLAANEKTTVIITTHYLEEARNADVIGIIRDGRVIAETSPNQLINSNGSSLQDAVLKLSRENSTFGIENLPCINLELIEINKTRGILQKKSPMKNFKESLNRIKVTIRKNFTVLLRNILLLSFVIWIPAFEALTVCLSFGNSPAHLKFGVLNQELNASACPPISSVQGECDLGLLSCAYLSHFSTETIELVPFDWEENAKSSVKSGSIWGYFILAPEFSSSIYERAVVGANIDEITINSSEIVVKLDETNKQVSTFIKIALYDALSDFTVSLLSNCGFDSRQGLSPFQYGIPVFGKKDGTDLREYASPSMGLGILFFWPILTVGTRFVEERKSGIMERSIVAGVRVWEIMISYFISEVFILIPQTVLTLAVVKIVAGIQIIGSIYLAFGLLLLAGCCGASLGFLFGSICREKVEVPILGLGSFMPNMVLCGIFWPLQGMPKFLQRVMNLLPCTLSAEAIRSIISRGWDLSHENVWWGFVVMTVHTFVYFLLAVLLHKFVKTH